MRSEDELFKEVYDSIEGEDISELDINSMISSFENIYQFSTEEFRKWYEDRSFEGNVDHQIWYMISS